MPRRAGCSTRAQPAVRSNAEPARRDGGRAALRQLIGRLEAAAGLPIPLDDQGRPPQRSQCHRAAGRTHLRVRRTDRQIRNADELAGVIAHEIGHVAHRDGTRSILQTAGLSFLFGMLLGDFVGGGAVVIGARAVLQSSYSRDVEAAADRYGVELMEKAGGDPRALGAVLGRIAGATIPGWKSCATIRRPKDARSPRINAAGCAKSRPRPPLLERAEWEALKRICADR